MLPTPRPTPTAALALLAVLTTALLAAPAPAQVALSGTIVEIGTRAPITNVRLQLISRGGDTASVALTDDRGGFRLEASEAGEYALSIQRLGYAAVHTEPMALTTDEELQVEITLDPQAVAMDGITVVAERAIAPWLREVRRRTERNRQAGVGRIFLREDLDRIRPHSVSDLLGVVGAGLRCNPTVLLDGLETEAAYIAHNSDMIEAVEIYRGPTQVPIEYSRYATCGVALVWTRPDPPGAKPLTWKRVVAAGVLAGVAALLVR